MSRDSQKVQKAGRPFGVTLAIIVSVLIFSVVPLLRVGGVLLVDQFFRNRDNTIVLPDGQEVEGISGGDLRGDIADGRLILQAGLAIAFFVVAIFAWVGRPFYIRYIFAGGVLLLSGLTIALTVLPSALSGGRGSGMVSGGSLDALTPVVLCVQFTSSVLVPLYVVWYMNRAPARAFYDGVPVMEPGQADPVPEQD